MKHFVFFLTFLSLGAGVLLYNSSDVLAVNYPAQNKNANKTIPVKANGVATTSCLARQDAVKKQMTSLIDLTTKMEKQFDLITQRAVDYYNNTVVPNGKIVPNYNALIADIQTNKDTVQAALNIAQTNSNNFNCSANNPKLLLSQYRVNMQTVKINLKSYRTSIKNLITAIRGVSPASVNKIENNQ